MRWAPLPPGVRFPILGGQMMRCLPWLPLLWLALVRLACAADQPVGEGEPFAQYFSPRDYHGGTQCLCAVQDRRGVMYIGSLGVILEYDGSAWRKIDLDSNYADGLAYDAATDTVYVAALNNLGYLQTLPGGERRFVSLLDQLPADARDVGSVSAVYVTPAGVYFVGTDRVLRWRDGRFHTWKLAAAATLESSLAAGVLYVSSPETGLLRLEGEALVPASDDPLFRHAKVRSVLADADGALLIGTRDGGFYALKDGAVRPLECECGEFVKRAGINKILRLRDGSLAVATRTAGLLVLDGSRRFRTRLEANGGLHGRKIFDLFEDAEGGLWVCLHAGISRVEVNSPFSVLRAGPDDDLASSFCSGHWFGSMALGNYTGIFRVATADPAAAVGAHLECVPGTALSATALCAVENGLLTVTNGTLCLLDAGARLVPVAGGISGPKDICASRAHPGRIYVVDEKGQISTLHLDRATERWVDDGVVADLGTKGESFGLGESARGDLWVQSTEHGLYRVEFPGTGPARVTSFFDRPGPLHGERFVGVCGGGDSPLRFMAPHLMLGLDDSGRELRPLTEFGEWLCNGSFWFTESVSYDEGSLWLTATDVRHPNGESLRGRALVGGPGRAPVFQALPHKIEEVIGSPSIYYPAEVAPDPLTTVLLVGTTGNGVVRVDLLRWDAEGSTRHFDTLIRRAVAAGGDASAAPSPILGEPLPYARNSVHFEFAAATLALGAAPRFQTRLAGFGAGGWSDWSERNSVDYLNLPEGSYTFEVRARNADGQLGSVASVPFRVLPPWQRSRWAYAFYVLAAAGVLAAFVRWRGWRLRQRNAALASLVDTRTRELRGARDDAESANRAKSAFLANMSHELRTPLNAVLGYTQLLLKEDELSARGRERVAVIGQSGGHLLALVNEVLDLSKVEAGKLTLSQFDYSLPQLLDETVATFRPRLAEKGLSFTEVRAPGLPTLVHSDPSRLRQVLFNLLSNAVKFTHRGGVTLTVRPTDPGRVRFEVADTGVGIAPEDQRDIFLAFHQVGERRLAAQGTGLGLAISQRLVELLGGRIEMESAPGRGSRFWFDLPLVAVEPSEGPSAEGLLDLSLGKVTGYEGTTRRLLLVDDLGENRRVLRDFLAPLGFEIEEAADGKACLAACARQKPDAVLLDLRLGAMDGYEVARSLRTLMNGARLGIIAITASVFEADRQQATDAGCDDFLPKPFEEAQLLGTLGRVLGLRWTQEAPVPAGPATDMGGVLPLAEIVLLRELALRGDVAGILRHLAAWRAAGASSDGAGEILHRLEALAAAYDMEGIHDLLLTLPTHDRD